MDIKDFKGISYFRFMVPAIYIALWIGMIAGPIFAPIIHREYCLIGVAFLAFKSMYQVILNLIMVVKTNQALKRAQDGLKRPIKQFGQLDQQIYHAFAIPSYKEDIELLAQTLEVLSKHKRATYTYLIFLAMEQHEQGSDLKAEELIVRFKSKFRYIDFTRHKIRQFQQKGKASNVSWCAQHMADKFRNLMINQDDVIMTVIDADSWAPDAYYDELEDHLTQNFDNRHNMLFQPSQICTRNNMEVPIFIRTYDDIYAGLHATTLITCSGISMSFSNYSLSYNLVKRMGFWDTVEQSIAQDTHMVFKSHFKTNGQVKYVPIFLPFNQLNIQTGEGYVADVKAKFWQLQRHARCISEVSYSILMFFKTEFSFRSLFLVLMVSQMILMPVIVPWSIFSLAIEDGVLHVDAPQEGILAPKYWIMFFNIANLFAFICPFFYEYMKRRASKVLYNIESPSLIHTLEVSICYSFNIVIIMSITYIMAAFGGLKKNREYVVAGKAYEIKPSSSQASLVEDITPMIEEEKTQLLQN